MTMPLFEPDAIMLTARAGKAFMRLAGLAFAQIAPDLTVKFISPNFLQFTADPMRSSKGRPLAEVLWEFAGLEAVLTAILDGEETGYQLDYVNRELPDGAMLYLTFQVTPLEVNRPASGLLLIVEDATRHGQREQALLQDRNEIRLVQAELAQTNAKLQHLNQYKSFLISMVAHDLRSPLTALRLYASSLLTSLTEGGSTRQRQALTNIRTQVERLTQFVTNLLDLDQIEQGRLALQYSAGDLKALLHEVVAMVDEPAALRGQTVRLDVPETPLLLQADTERLRQILYNLLSNAVKYTPVGGHIQLSAAADGAAVVVQVTDNGPGLTSTELENLFQLYYRTADARQSKTPGTGLGLFIVKTLVEAHHGQVTVHSQLGQGTTFTLRLPTRPEAFADA